jgi:predicted Fe-Mo cluster-binding NifX family protein
MEKTMKICMSSTGKDMSSQIDPRFGRCGYFLMVQTDDMGFEAFENDFRSLGGGAGIQAANFVQSKGAKTIITGNCGPNAMAVFSRSNIPVVTGQAGLIQEVVERFKNGELSASVLPTVDEKDGMPGKTGTGPGARDPQDRGTGPGMGGGRGIGCGGGRGMGGGGRGMGGGGGMGGGRRNA